MSADKQRLTKRPEQSWSALRAMFCAERLQSLAASHTFFRAERFKLGGAGRDRTGDLLSANQALSQLSYSPWLVAGRWQEPTTNHDFVIEADWTLPAGARPYRQSKSQNSKWRSETDLDWKGYYLLTVKRLAICSTARLAPIR
jgi:hypothetical protein